MTDDDSGSGRVAAVRPVARIAILGFLLGGGVLLALVLAGRSVQAASTLSFSLGALVFGFGLAAWAGTLMFGRSLEAAHRHLDADAGWTAMDSRQAMAVLCALGGGAMIGTVVVTILLGVA